MSNIDNLNNCILTGQSDFEPWPVDEMHVTPDLSIPDPDDSIIAELMNAGLSNEHNSMVPVPLLTVASPCTPHHASLPDAPHHTSAFTLTNTPSALKRKATRARLDGPSARKKPALLSNFVSAVPKAEPRLSAEAALLPLEPLTPSRDNKMNTMAQIIHMPSDLSHSVNPPRPLTPTADSACSFDDETASFPAFPSSPLPMPSRAVAARRRAYRSKALKRSRARAGSKDEHAIYRQGPSGSSFSGDMATTIALSGPGPVEEVTEHLVDKKVARAIRNRQAAQRSRIEAKAKMHELSIQNDELSKKVESLRCENEQLKKQLHSVVVQSIGDNIDIDQIFDAFERTKSCHMPSFI